MFSVKINDKSPLYKSADRKSEKQSPYLKNKDGQDSN
jgi:hypothetical protein